MPTLTQGAAPNIVSANIYEERSATLITAQILDTSALTANVLATRTYTIVAAGTTPTTGQIAISGVQAGDQILAVSPASSGSTIAATATAVAASVTSASTIAITWNNTAATAPTTAAGPISLLLYRPVTSTTKNSFEG